MKPKTPEAMQMVIRQVREVLPFSMTEDELCAETCSHGCPKNLLEYIDIELTDWEQRIENGELPSLADIQKISKSSQKIYSILKKNKLVT